jgi:hypothetical protein
MTLTILIVQYSEHVYRTAEVGCVADRIYSRSFSSAVRLQPTAPSGRKVAKLSSVLKMAVCEGLECCVLAITKRTFLWQCKDNLIASAVGIHEVNHRFWLWMIFRVVTARAKLPANNPCVTNVLDNLGVLVNNGKSKPLCSSAAVSQSNRPIESPPPSPKTS